ncbi:6-pyruvoyl tetrahydrobiopterin synthase [Cyclospora cayetanensis]|uniref:6-pyruvoyltetrahydropterin synthase n=1 Tax=Cyclospora cayetanensis TaxID=88456 RepID=A0A1D3D8P6_9EIME|nr:6-pyruvoyl tetrahydrobiopterin synthase [Cyclospora cayetanensis]
MNAFLISSLQQQQPHHVASSSVAATEGSPPSSPRSTFSSVHSYGQDAYSPAIPAVSASIDLSAPRGTQETDTCSARGNPLSTSLGGAGGGGGSSLDGGFEVTVCLLESSFCCAHFVAYKGYRERLHGHNYQVSARLLGPLGVDGYVLDFTELKRAVREVCKPIQRVSRLLQCVLRLFSSVNRDNGAEHTSAFACFVLLCAASQSLNEYTIIPMRSDVLEITQEGSSIRMRCEDGSEFILPRADCLCLPIVHSTAEELCAYIWRSIVDNLTEGRLKKRGIQSLEVSVAEKCTQVAVYRRPL